MDNYTSSSALQQKISATVRTPSPIITVKDNPQTTQDNRKGQIKETVFK